MFGKERVAKMMKIDESTVFEIIPYSGTNLVTFGMKPYQVERVLGKSKIKSKDHQGRFDESWPGINVGYSESDIVDHIGFSKHMKNIIFSRINLFGLPSSVVLRELMEIDTDPMEYLGMVIFLKLGFYLTGFEDDGEDDDKAAALFVHGRWDSRMSKMKKFKLA
jgi:hypothetical protein